MIYHHTSKTCIITPPKCGSVILHHFLCQDPNYWYVLGQSSWDTTTKHCPASSINSHEIQIDRWVILIRHPIPRIISMWKHQVSHDGYTGSLMDFIKERDLSVDWYSPCADYTNGINIGGVIRQENLYRDTIDVLGVEIQDINILKMNCSKFQYKPSRDEMSALIDVTKKIYHRDIKIGGYEIGIYK